MYNNKRNIKLKLKSSSKEPKELPLYIKYLIQDYAINPNLKIKPNYKIYSNLLIKKIYYNELNNIIIQLKKPFTIWYTPSYQYEYINEYIDFKKNIYEELENILGKKINKNRYKLKIFEKLEGRYIEEGTKIYYDDVFSFILEKKIKRKR